MMMMINHNLLFKGFSLDGILFCECLYDANNRFQTDSFKAFRPLG